MFDCPRAKVSDAMIEALYLNESATAPAPVHHETPDRLAVGACFRAMAAFPSKRHPDPAWRQRVTISIV